MSTKGNSSSRTYFIIAAVLVLFDQITKLAVKGGSILGLQWDGMQLGESIEVLGSALRWTFVENPGMAWGIEFGEGKIVLTLVTIVIACGLAWYLHRMRFTHWSVKTALCLVLAGAVGNLIDRMFYGVFYHESPLFYGKVVDFIQVDIPDVTVFGTFYSHFPVFNIADSCVSVGIVMLFLVSGKAQPHVPAASVPAEKQEIETNNGGSELSRED